MLLFEDLVNYTKTVKENKSFRNGDFLIDIDEYADSISIFLENGSDHVLIRFENRKSLVKTVFNNQTERVILGIHEVPRYLRKKFDIDVMDILTEVPYIQKVLAD